MTRNMNELFIEHRKVHVLYSYRTMSSYLKQVLSFIEEGLVQEEYVLLVENERLSLSIMNELRKRFSAEQLEFVHLINSLHFYRSSGSYHPPAIAEYFTKTVEPYVKNGVKFRSWAHVEWATMTEPHYLIKDFEKIVDGAVNDYAFPLICAYASDKMPDHLLQILLETHPYVLVENELVQSVQYQ